MGIAGWSRGEVTGIKLPEVAVVESRVGDTKSLISILLSIFYSLFLIPTPKFIEIGPKLAKSRYLSGILLTLVTLVTLKRAPGEPDW